MSKLGPNQIVIVDGTGIVLLNRNLIAKVDVSDIPLIKDRRWFANPWSRGFYAMNRKWNGPEQITTLMHRLILAPGDGLFVDHINGDGLDNRRANLRPASPQENAWNSKISIANRSGVRGVHWHAEKRKWRAMIRVGAKATHLGYFTEIEDAAAAYAAAALDNHGEFARP